MNGRATTWGVFKVYAFFSQRVYQHIREPNQKHIVGQLVLTRFIVGWVHWYKERQILGSRAVHPVYYYQKWVAN